MRLITWNCFRGDALTRAGDVADLGADVLLLQECARPADGDTEAVAWFGANPKHGMAVVARPPYELRPAPVAGVAGDPHGDVAFPVRVVGPRSFHLLAVWAKPRPSYVGSVWAALDAYAGWLREAPAVVAGDFNSHPRWDRGTGRTHTRLAARLRDEFGLVSAWHAAAARTTTADVEEPATHYHQWRAGRGFHIDYCFVPAAWAAELAVRVPDEPAGARASDHRPLVVDLASPRSAPSRVA